MLETRLPRALLVGAVLTVTLAASSVAEADRFHTVRQGETLSAIARRHGTSVSTLQAANELQRAQQLRSGQTLRIPPRGVVYVGRGQTLSAIARRHDTTITALARANDIRPGQTLREGQRLWLPGFQRAAEPTPPRDWGEPAEEGVIHLQTDAGPQRIRLLDHEGRVMLNGLRTLAAHMGSDEQHPPNPRLAALIARISDHFGGRPVVIVSGFRRPVRYTRGTSRHVSGSAADVRVVGVPNRALWDYCRSLSDTGCGLYPRSSFAHVDVRATPGQWVDWSRPGRRPRYGTLRGPRRQSRRALGRTVTRPDVLPSEVRLSPIKDERELPEPDARTASTAAPPAPDA